MSPEIFKNKPYSYKSDVWALGCVLYEMTTLNHAFDANSLNGLATKIVKGKYPPINPKYSKYLSELIGQMLQLNPQQRPDLDQILRKPFIKKHIINFFTDIASRPSASIGEGTMIFKAAAGGPDKGSAVANDTNMISLRQQLNSLGLTEAVAEALAPKSTPQDDFEAIKYAREQASALQREKEHKKMVEAALEKLRLERENRAKDRVAAPAGMVRPSGYPVPQARPAAGQAAAAAAARVAARPGAIPSAAPSAAPSRNPSMGGPSVPISNIEAARREAVRRQQGDDVSENGDGSSVSGGRNKDAARRRSFGEDADRDSRNPDPRVDPRERDRKAVEDRRRQEAEQVQRQRADEKKREDARVEAKAREDARMRDEARSKEEVQARIRVEQIKVDQVRAQAEMAAKAKREALRDRERARQKEEIEQLKRDKLELDRRANERDRVREERRAQERERLEGNRREQMEVVQEKIGNMNEQISRIEKNPRPRGAPDRAEEKYSNEELSARDRVLMRRQEKQAKDEADRIEQLRAAEHDNRRIRQDANNNYRHQYYGESYDAPNYEFDTSDRGKPNNKGRMDAGELNDRLAEATKGKNRFDGGAGNDRGNERPGYEYGSDSGSENDGESVFEGNPSEPNAIEEEEDMVRREEELRAELNFATCRVEELKRTLQETKSFLGPRLPTRGRDAPPTAKGREGMVVQNEDVFEEQEEEVEEDDDYLYFDQSDNEVSTCDVLCILFKKSDIVCLRHQCRLISFPLLSYFVFFFKSCIIRCSIFVNLDLGYTRRNSCPQFQACTPRARAAPRAQAGHRRHGTYAGRSAQYVRRAAGHAVTLRAFERSHRATTAAVHGGPRQSRLQRCVQLPEAARRGGYIVFRCICLVLLCKCTCDLQSLPPLINNINVWSVRLHC